MKVNWHADRLVPHLNSLLQGTGAWGAGGGERGEGSQLSKPNRQTPLHD